MNYENGRSSDNYATVTVTVKNGEDVYTYDIYISNKNGITVTAPDDEHKKKQVSEFLACAYAVSKVHVISK